MPAHLHLRRHWALFAGLIVALAVWCAVDVSRRARVDPQRPSQHMTDVTVYTEAGRAFFDGRDPYEVANIRGWKYLYPPLFALLIAPLSYLTPPWQATAWFAVSALMCFGSYFECRRLLKVCRIDQVRQRSSGVAEFARIQFEATSLNSGEFSYGARRQESLSNAINQRLPFWLIAAATVTAILPALNCLQRGQMGIALLYPLLLGLRLIIMGRTPLAWMAAGIVLALPIALKLTPALPVACVLFVSFVAAAVAELARVQRANDGLISGESSGQPGSLPNPAGRGHSWSCALWSTSGCLAGSILFFLLIPASLVGWDKNLAYLNTWYDKVATKVNDVRTDDFAEKVDSPRNQSLSNAVFRFGNWVAYEFVGGPDDQVTGKANGLMPMDAPLVSQILLVVRGLALLALLGVAIRAGRSSDPLLSGAALGLACVATLVVSPVARGHYFVLFLPAVLFVPLWLIQTGKPGAAFRAAVIPAVLVALHYVLLKYAGRIGVLGIGTTLWYFAECANVTFGRGEASQAVDRDEQLLELSRAA